MYLGQLPKMYSYWKHSTLCDNWWRFEGNWTSNTPSASCYICRGGQNSLCWKLGLGCHFGSNGPVYILYFIFSTPLISFFWHFFLFRCCCCCCCCCCYCCFEEKIFFICSFYFVILQFFFFFFFFFFKYFFF